MHATEAFDRVLALPGIERVLDIGCGKGSHTEAFKQSGKHVTALDSHIEYSKAELFRYGSVPYVHARDQDPYDLVWASHVLEHVRTPGKFIQCMFADCKPDGYVAITVPPRKDEIVGGHVTLWNAGLLIYNICLEGIDCKDVKVKTYGYNVSVIAQNKRFNINNVPLTNDQGDIEMLLPWLPDGFYHGINGMIDELNW